MSRPVIYLRRQRIADAWTHQSDHGVLALSSITIPWGRESIFDKVEPHVCTIKVIDLARDAERYVSGTLLGARVQVVREDDGAEPVTLLDGQVTEQAARELTVRDPRTGGPRRVLELTLSVADVPGVLSAITRRGAYIGLQVYGQGGVPTDRVPGPWARGGWDAHYLATRMAEILSREVSWLRSADVPADTRPTPSHELTIGTGCRAIVQGVPAGSLVDLWSLVHQVYASGQGLGWPRLRPGVGVSQGMPQTAGQITLALQGGQLVLVHSMAEAPADQLALADAEAFPISTTADLAATISVEISRHRYRWQTELRDQFGAVIREEQLLDDDESTTVQEPVAGVRGSDRDVTLDLGASGTTILPYNTADAGEYNPATDGGAHRGWNYAIAIAQEAAARAALLSEWLTHPPLTYSPAEGADEIPTLLQTWDSDATWLAGSKWASVRRAPRVVQFIGGTLAYEDGRWSHELTVAPTIDTAARDIPLSALLGNVNSPISAFADAVTLNPLSAASRSTAT